MTNYEQNYREIITKAVCGTGKGKMQAVDMVRPKQQPSSILGCWIINHKYRAKRKSDQVVEIEGSYDINVWYSFQENTRTEVVLEEVHYSDEITLHEIDQHSLTSTDEVIAKVIKQPNCSQCSIDKDHMIKVEVEKEFVVEVIGETKVKVQVIPVPVKSNPSQTPAVKRVK